MVEGLGTLKRLPPERVSEIMRELHKPHPLGDTGVRVFRSRKRWWMDHEGNLWVNIEAVRKRPLTKVEWAKIEREGAELERVGRGLN